MEGWDRDDEDELVGTEPDSDLRESVLLHLLQGLFELDLTLVVSSASLRHIIWVVYRLNGASGSRVLL